MRSLFAAFGLRSSPRRRWEILALESLEPIYAEISIDMPRDAKGRTVPVGKMHFFHLSSIFEGLFFEVIFQRITDMLKRSKKSVDFLTRPVLSPSSAREDYETM